MDGQGQCGETEHVVGDGKWEGVGEGRGDVREGRTISFLNTRWGIRCLQGKAGGGAAWRRTMGRRKNDGEIATHRRNSPWGRFLCATAFLGLLACLSHLVSPSLHPTGPLAIPMVTIGAHSDWPTSASLVLHDHVLAVVPLRLRRSPLDDQCKPSVSSTTQ